MQHVQSYLLATLTVHACFCICSLQSAVVVICKAMRSRHSPFQKKFQSCYRMSHYMQATILTKFAYLQASKEAASAKQASKKQPVSDKVCKNTNESMQSCSSTSCDLKQSNLRKTEQACSKKYSGPVQVWQRTTSFCYVIVLCFS